MYTNTLISTDMKIKYYTYKSIQNDLTGYIYLDDWRYHRRNTFRSLDNIYLDKIKDK